MSSDNRWSSKRQPQRYSALLARSPGDLEPVFTTMVEKAVRICDAKFGTLYLHEEGGLRLVAGHDVPEFLEARGSSPIQPAPVVGLTWL